MHKKNILPELSVIIPTYSETDRINRTLKQVTEFGDKNYPGSYEIIVVDDPNHSGQYTEIAPPFSETVTFIKQPQRLGKGAAVKTGVLKAQGKMILFMDADSATSIEEFSRFAPFFTQDCMVTGVRHYCENESRRRRIIGLMAQLFLHIFLFKRAVPDSQCGFKAFSKSVAHTVFPLVKTNGGIFDAEIFYIVHKLDIPIFYVPVAWKNDPNSRINILMCMIRDPIDVFRILIRNFFSFGKIRK